MGYGFLLYIKNVFFVSRLFLEKGKGRRRAAAPEVYMGTTLCSNTIMASFDQTSIVCMPALLTLSTYTRVLQVDNVC